MSRNLLITIGCSLLLLPFFLLCLYNQPTGDDMWYTWMAKQYGFIEVQRQWYITINGRFSSNIFMSLNSWIYGSITGFKIWPAFIILAWIFAIFRLLKKLTRAKTSALFAYSLLFVCGYYLSMPGIHEGTYWMSSVTGYQIPLILYTICLPLLLKEHSSQSEHLLIGIVLFVAGGFHEIIALIACITFLYVAGIKKKLRVAESSKWLIAGISSGLAFLIQLASIGNRYKAVTSITATKWGLFKVIKLTIMQTGYHILVHCFLSPSFWLVVLLAWFVGYRYLKYYNRFHLSLKSNLLIILAACIPLTILPVFVNIYLYNDVAPLRIINLSIFVWLAGTLLIAALFGYRYKRREKLIFHNVKTAHTSIILLLVLIIAAFFSRNERQAVITLFNGTAYYYNSEVNERWEKLSHRAASTCIIPCLKYQPEILCPVDICQNDALRKYMEKIYRKKIIVR